MVHPIRILPILATTGPGYLFTALVMVLCQQSPYRFAAKRLRDEHRSVDGRLYRDKQSSIEYKRGRARIVLIQLIFLSLLARSSVRLSVCL